MPRTKSRVVTIRPYPDNRVAFVVRLIVDGAVDPSGIDDLAQHITETLEGTKVSYALAGRTRTGTVSVESVGDVTPAP
jgi:hypothetical protein